MNKLTIFDNKLYISGNPSYMVDPETLSIKQLGNFHSFIEVDNCLYGNSDEMGITSLSTN